MVGPQVSYFFDPHGVVEAEARVRMWKETISRIQECRSCGLCHTRRNVVPGFWQGGEARVIFIGEAPGADEDASGIPFVGRAGQLLDVILEKYRTERNNAEIAILNICKCRPPENRKPTPGEMSTCGKFLETQLALLQPKVIVTLGDTPMRHLADISQKDTITYTRGRWVSMRHGFPWPLMPTWHPSFALRRGGIKSDAGEQMIADIGMALARAGLIEEMDVITPDGKRIVVATKQKPLQSNNARESGKPGTMESEFSPNGILDGLDFNDKELELLPF